MSNKSLRHVIDEYSEHLDAGPRIQRVGKPKKKNSARHAKRKRTGKLSMNARGNHRSVDNCMLRGKVR